MQSVTGSFLAFINVLSIFVFPVLLKFDYPLSIMNKLNLLFGLGCMGFMQYYRLSHGGKVCSGDYIQESDLNKTEELEGYLILRGELMWWYMKAFWIFMGLLFAIVIGAIIATLKSLR